MDISFRSTEFEPDEPLIAYVEKKVAKLQRYVPDIERADIELSEEPTRGVEARRIVQINLIMYGKVIARVERRAADSHVAIDAAVDTLKQQLLRYKEARVDWRHHERERKAIEKAEEEVVVVEEEEEEAS